MNASKERGWVRLHRKIEENYLYFSEPFNRAFAWVDILLLCNHKEQTIFVRGNKIIIGRGQFARSENSLSQRWRWSREKVRNFLEELEKNKMIIQQKDRVLSLYTIINYEYYQKDQTTDQTTEKQQTRQQKNINNNTNNNNNDKKSVFVQKNQKEINQVPEYLISIPEEDLPKLMDKLNVNATEVKRKGEQIYNWVLSHPKNKRADYRAVLRNALIKDFGYQFKS